MLLTKMKLLAVSLVAIFGTTYNNYAFASLNDAFSSGVLHVPDLETMINNLATSVPNLTKLVTAGTYVVGMFLMFSAVIKMKHFGAMRGMMGREHDIWGPIIQFFIGAALIYLPSMVGVTMQTLWRYDSPLAYVSSTDSNNQFIAACYSIVQMIGVISFVKGLIYLNRAGNDKGQGQNVLGKGLTHVIGGILCINIYGTIQTLEATVGMMS